MLRWPSYVLGLLLALSTSASARPPPYVVDGLALGARVIFESDEYKQYQCTPSEFTGLVWCQKRKTERTENGEVFKSNSILHKPDGTAVYVNRYIEPAFFSSKDIRTEIARLSAKFGESARELRMSQREGLPRAVIAIWGNIELKQLDANDSITLAAGGSPHRGILVGFLGDLRRSAKLGVPVYRITGSTGFVWAASFDQEGRGNLRFFTIDVSQIVPQGTPAQESYTWADCELDGKYPDRAIVACSQMLEATPPSRRAE